MAFMSFENITKTESNTSKWDDLIRWLENEEVIAMAFENVTKTESNTPKWDDLIRWLELRDPTEEYSYGSPTCCLAAQFNKAHGRAYVVPLFNAIDLKVKTGDFDTDMENIARGPCDFWYDPPERTFGAALKRAKEFA